MKDDTVSRRAAIDAVSEACFELRGIFKECEERLLALPSAQPEIIRCKDCKWLHDNGQELICKNPDGWVVATSSNFGCVYAERRTDD